MEPYEQFKQESAAEIANQGKDARLKDLTRQWFDAANAQKYSYHFEWLGRPIIQYPQDIVATQEIIWNVKPDLIIETGIAHGGSLILSASILAMLDYDDALSSGGVVDPSAPRRKVMGVDIDIREHNRLAISKHCMSPRIKMIQGSSVSPEVVEQVKEYAKNFERVMVFLDSNHTHEHVLGELEAYAPLVTEGSYCVVFDSVIEDLPADSFKDRAWAPGNSPKSALRQYITDHGGFEIDREMDDKLLISVAPEGYLKRTS